jgi:hypothetical protein
MYVVLGFGVAETGFESSAVSRYNLARNEGEQVGVNDVPVVEHFGDFLTPPRSLLLTTFPSVAAAAGAAAGGRDRFKRFEFRIL